MKSVNARLSVMMFLQFFIWGAWLPLFFNYLTGHVGLPGERAGWLFSIGATGALLAPFIAGPRGLWRCTGCWPEAASR